MMLVFDPEKHEYSLDGIILPSVTTLLKECGIINTTFYTGNGADNGKRRHLVTELFDQERLDWESVLEEDLPYLSSWIQFKKDFNVEIQAIEQKMYHSILRYAGCVDRLVEIGGKPTVIDIKTGQKQKWHELQLILYGLMCIHNDIKPNLMCVYLKKTGKYSIEEYGYENERYALSAVRVAQWKNR